MKIIVPMAGRGSRLRPHTLTVPKPLIPIGGKPIVQRLVEDIAKVAGEEIDEIAFIIGDFGPAVEASLLKIAEKLGAKGSIYTQDQPLGTAHAIKCAEASMQGDVVVAFADTLFRADFNLDKNSDGVIWVKSVEDPSAFGVVKLDDQGYITDFVEKPEEFVSDLAIIGIYYFKSAEKLMDEINYIMSNDIMQGGEYQLTTALENLRQKGAKFSLGKVDDWMDCGNKNATVETNGKILNYDNRDNRHLKEVQQVSRMMEKLQRKGKTFSTKNVRETLHDIAGVRVICNYIEDIYRIADLLIRQPDIELVRQRDFP